METGKWILDIYNSSEESKNVQKIGFRELISDRESAHIVPNKQFLR